MSRRLLPAVIAERLRGVAERLPSEASQALALRVISRAERVFEQLEATAQVLDKVARTELALLEKLEPIVDDLGRLVRLQLDEARRRITGPSAPTSPRVIEVSSEERPGRSHE